MERIYRAKNDAVERLEKKKTSEILQIVGFGLLALMILLFRREEQLRELARDMNASMDVVRGWLTFFLIACALFAICSIAIAVDVSSKLEKLKNSYVKITVDGVFGVSSEGSEFYVAYKDIQKVTAKESEEENLTIYGKMLTYQCYGISKAEEFAREVNRILKGGEPVFIEQDQWEQDEKTHCLDDYADATAFEGAVSGEREAYFLNCRSRKVICPFCETEQNSMRDKCTGCGVDFVFEYE